MRNSSSISNSDLSVQSDISARAFWKRLRLFFLPFVFLPFLFAPAISTGELLPMWLVSEMQYRIHGLLFLQKYTDHTFALKVLRANRERAQVVVLGSSRTNQWRSGHFKPYTFYNAGNISARFADLIAVLDRLEYDPKVIVFSIDFFMFSDAWSPQSDLLSKNDLEYPEEAAFVLRGIIGDYVRGSIPLVPPIQEPVYHQYAVGLQASLNGNGFRVDGSYQYGSIYQGKGHGVATLEDAISRIDQGTPPFLFGASVDTRQAIDFQEFVEKAKKRGIKLVGVTTAYNPTVVETMQASDKHGLWREFRSEAFQKWLRNSGVLVFDFTELSSFGGQAEEFVDTFHPSEPAFSRQLLTMLGDDEFTSWLPAIDPLQVMAALNRGSRYEVYRNEF